MSLVAFEHTAVGFRRAKRWLKTNHYWDVLEHHGSDAKMLVDTANVLRSQQLPHYVEPDYPE